MAKDKIIKMAKAERRQLSAIQSKNSAIVDGE